MQRGQSTPSSLRYDTTDRLEHVAAEHGMTGLELFGYKAGDDVSKPVVRRMQRVPVVTDTLQPYNLVATGNKYIRALRTHSRPNKHMRKSTWRSATNRATLTTAYGCTWLLHINAFGAYRRVSKRRTDVDLAEDSSVAARGPVAM